MVLVGPPVAVTVCGVVAEGVPVVGVLLDVCSGFQHLTVAGSKVVYPETAQISHLFAGWLYVPEAQVSHLLALGL